MDENSAVENESEKAPDVETLWNEAEETDAPPAEQPEENAAPPEDKAAPEGKERSETPAEPDSGGEKTESSGVPSNVPDSRQPQRARVMRELEMQDFLSTYPDVKPESIPAEVWAEVRTGRTLVNAYTMHQNQVLKARLAAAEQNRQNRERAPGSMRSQGERGKKSIAELWDEAGE